MFETPILFLIFNRPYHTRQVFERIRQIKPKLLFVSADGPRKDRVDDIDKCKEVRQIVMNGTDWDCDVRTLFRKENLGCGIAVSEAITWFFKHIEQGIILEDDTVPSLSFFSYCKELLSFYREDYRIMHISGCNHGMTHRGTESYYFSRHAHIWGWASWRRAWRHYNFEMENWPIFKKEIDMVNLFGSKAEKIRRESNWEKAFEKLIDSWDYQWSFAIQSQGGLSILPSQNMIKNIGNDLEGTHTKGGRNVVQLEALEINLPLVHPIFLIPNHQLDEVYNLKNQIITTPLFEKLIKKLAKLLR